MSQPIIYHIDVNSAFLSWEATYRKSLDPNVTDIRTIPAAIGGDEKTRHGIVLAKSILAKKCGVTTGEPLLHAKRKCPNLTIIPPNFPIYVQYSNQFMDILKEVAPVVEQFSIDEAFCDMTGTTSLYGDPVAFAHKLKDRIYDELGFSVNVGISCNKLLAKMASDFEKPNKVHTLFPDELPQKFWPLPIEDLLYVGKSTAKKLRSFGITTIGELARSDKQTLVTLLKSHGETLWNYANGIDTSSLTPERAANKCYGNSLTVPFDVTDADTAKHILLSLCETVGARIRSDQVYINVIQITILDCEFHQTSHQITLENGTNVTETIYQYACQLFTESWNHIPIRLLGVSTSKPSKDNYEQYHLFQPCQNEKLSKLNLAVDSIRNKYGDDAIKRACFVKSDTQPSSTPAVLRGLSHAKEDAKRKPNLH